MARTRTLLQARADDSNWMLPAKSYASNHYAALTQVDEINVARLSQAWRTDIADDGEQKATPIVWNGRMYIATPHGGVLAQSGAQEPSQSAATRRRD